MKASHAGLQYPLPQAALTEFCQRHHINWLAVFGSVLRDDFTPGSGIDFLVEFEPGHVPLPGSPHPSPLPS